jgi:hypothetical protein
MGVYLIGYPCTFALLYTALNAYITVQQVRGVFKWTVKLTGCSVESTE